MPFITRENLSIIKEHINQGTFPRNPSRNQKIHSRIIKEISHIIGLKDSVLRKAITISSFALKEKIFTSIDPVQMSLITLLISAQTALLPITLHDLSFILNEPSKNLREYHVKILEHTKIELPPTGLYIFIERYCNDLQFPENALNLCLAIVTLLRKRRLFEGLSAPGLSAAIICTVSNKLSFEYTLDKISETTLVPRVTIQNRVQEISKVLMSDLEGLISSLYFPKPVKTDLEAGNDFILSFNVPVNEKETMVEIWNSLGNYSSISSVKVGEFNPTRLNVEKLEINTRISVPELTQEEKLTEIRGLMNNIMEESPLITYDISLDVNKDESLDDDIINQVDSLPDVFLTKMEEKKKSATLVSSQKDVHTKIKQLNSETIQTKSIFIFDIIESGDIDLIQEMTKKIVKIGQKNPETIRIILPKMYETFLREESILKTIMMKTLRKIPYEEKFSQNEILSLLDLDLESLKILDIVNSGINGEIELQENSGLSRLEFRKKVKYLLSEGIIVPEWKGLTKSFRINDNSELLTRLKSNYPHEPIPIP